MTCSAAALTRDLNVSGCRDMFPDPLLRECGDSSPRRIEVKRMPQAKFNLLAGLQRLMGIRQRDHGLPPVLEMNVILLAQMLDTVHAPDQRSAVSRGNLQMLRADANRLGPRRGRHTGGERDRQ